jgi:hypothetical protein
MVAMDLQSHRNLGQGLFVVTIRFNAVMFYAKNIKKSLHEIDFPSRIFIEHLFEITQTRFQRLHTIKVLTNTQLVVPISSITSSVDSFKATMQHHQMKLLQTLNFSIRRSPKRRLDSVAPSELGR